MTATKKKRAKPIEIKGKAGKTKLPKPSNGRIPLKIDTKCIASDETLLAQIEANANRGLPEFIPYPNPHKSVICLVGSGPSVRGQLDSILEQKKKGRLIVALKGAHDFLLDNGIKPDWCVMLDPQEKIVNCVTKHEPEITYFIASQCHPKVFDLLKERYVILWHALSGIGENKILEGRVLLGGGTTTGLRTMNLVYSLGYRYAHIYGFDSCVTEQEGKTYKRINIHSEKGMDEPGRIIDVWVGKKRFWANPAMAAQADEFQRAMVVLKGMKVQVHGEGLIAEMWKQHIGRGGGGWFEE
jgi:hypothetical protein